MILAGFSAEGNESQREWVGGSGGRQPYDSKKTSRGSRYPEIHLYSCSSTALAVFSPLPRMSHSAPLYTHTAAGRS